MFLALLITSAHWGHTGSFIAADGAVSPSTAPLTRAPGPMADAGRRRHSGDDTVLEQKKVRPETSAELENRDEKLSE